MAFHDVRFPTTIDYGSSGGPSFDVELTTVAHGHKEVVLRSPDAPRSFNARYDVKTIDDVRNVLTFFLAREGPTHTFRYYDWMDNSSAANHVGTPTTTDQVIGFGDGSTRLFQLKKTYQSGANAHVRTITKPQTGTVLVSIDDVNQSSGWTVNTQTGLITFSTPPGVGEVIKAGYYFDCQVRFANDAGEELVASIKSFRTAGIPDIPLYEELGVDLVPTHQHYGGAVNHGVITDDILLIPVSGRVQIVSPATTGHSLILPPTGLRLPLGAVYFYLINSGSEDVDIANADGSSIFTLEPAMVAHVALTADSSGNPEWMVWA